MGLFDKRVAFKPFEYPEVVKFKEAIQHSFWLVGEWNFVSDVHDFNVKLSPAERNAIKNSLLSISQIEVSVKRFWTKLGERFPKAEIEQVGVCFGECFVDGTEILTPNGWVDLEKVKVGDEVLQFNPDSTFNITKVKHKTDQFFEGEMVRFHKRTTETMVTPNHRMLYFNKKGQFVEEEAKSLALGKSLKDTRNLLPEAGKLKGDVHELTPIDRLRIAIQADGNRRYYNSGYGRKLRKGKGKGAEYEIRIVKERKIARLDWILSQVEGVTYSKRPIPSRPGMFCYTVQIDAEWDYKNFDWVSLHGKSSQWCEDFVQELSEWDGTRLPKKKDCKIKFGTTNKRAADAAQMVGVGAGYRTNLSEHEDARSETFSTSYIVSFTTNREKVTLPPLKAQFVEYAGPVRCVTVESGAIITRLNGKTFISGNSEVRHADAYSHLLEVLSLNNDFDQLLTNPVIQGRLDYLSKYIKGSADNTDQNFTLTLTLFSLFIENVSLFSQFLVIQSFNKYKGLLKDIDNVVQATQQEESIHAKLGAYLLGVVRDENPEWFTEDFYSKVYRACKKALDAELKIIDWIFEVGELEFLSKITVREFVKDRFNQSLLMIGGSPQFDVNQEELAKVKWFDEGVLADTHIDFFHKRSTGYSKNTKPITAGDLF